MKQSKDAYGKAIRALNQPPARRPRRGFNGPLGELLYELRQLFHLHLRVAATCERAVGAKTSRERRIVMTRMLVDLYRGGHKLHHLKNLGKKHVLAILTSWSTRRLAASTMASYVSHLRSFCTWLGKTHMLDVIQRYVDEHPALTRRHTATDHDKSEQGVNVAFVDVQERARAIDEHFACQLALIEAFGLRSREAWLFRPHLAEDGSGRVTVMWGTKGGRSRVLPLPISAKQREVLGWAKRLVQTRCESMVPRSYTLKQWAYRYYRLCRRIGLTRRQLAVTPHSFRHGVLLNLYETLSGRPAPVRDCSGERPDPAVDRAAREVVSETAGHSRTSVVSAYLGGVRRSEPGES